MKALLPGSVLCSELNQLPDGVVESTVQPGKGGAAGKPDEKQDEKGANPVLMSNGGASGSAESSSQIAGPAGSAHSRKAESRIMPIETPKPIRAEAAAESFIANPSEKG